MPRDPPRVEPRGGRWVVSLCNRGGVWRTLDWIGSHFEADYVADRYRRNCRRVAVHREGQPARERTAPVLPASYRPPPGRDRDPDTTARIAELLARFVRGDHDAGFVLQDLLIEDGFDWAAQDLRETMSLGCRERRGLADRILSEVTNDATVLEHGEWLFRMRRGQEDWNPFVLILERNPTLFRGGRRSTSRKREPRLVIWSRSGGAGDCRWRLFGDYPESEFGSLDRAEEIARHDIAYACLAPEQQRERLAMMPPNELEGEIEMLATRPALERRR